MKIISAFVIIQISFEIFPDPETNQDEQKETTTQYYSKKNQLQKLIHQKRFIAKKNFGKIKPALVSDQKLRPKSRFVRHQFTPKLKSKVRQETDVKRQYQDYVKHIVTDDEGNLKTNPEFSERTSFKIFPEPAKSQAEHKETANQVYSQKNQYQRIYYHSICKTKINIDGACFKGNISPKLQTTMKLKRRIFPLKSQSKLRQDPDVKSQDLGYVKHILTDEEVNFQPNSEFSERNYI